MGLICGFLGGLRLDCRCALWVSIVSNTIRISALHHGLGFRVLGFRVSGFRVLGFRV